MDRSRAGIVAAAALVSLACLGAALRNVAAVRDLRAGASGSSAFSESPAGGAAALRGEIERDVESLRRRIGEERGRYGGGGETEFLDFIGTVLNIVEEHRITVERLDIRERGVENLLEVAGEGSITDILSTLAALQNLENPVVMENLGISEGRVFHRFSAVLRPASVPGIREAEPGEAAGGAESVHLPERAVIGNPPAWAGRLFGFRPVRSGPRTAPPEPARGEAEPPSPDWIVYVGRFRTAGNRTAYAFRDERDGRIRLLSHGETKHGWRLLEDGPGTLVVLIDEHQYTIKVSK